MYKLHKSVIGNIQEIDAIFDQLHQLFESKEDTKAAIVDILKVYLVNPEKPNLLKGVENNQFFFVFQLLLLC